MRNSNGFLLLVCLLLITIVSGTSRATDYVLAPCYYVPEGGSLKEGVAWMPRAEELGQYESNLSLSMHEDKMKWDSTLGNCSNGNDFKRMAKMEKRIQKRHGYSLRQATSVNHSKCSGNQPCKTFGNNRGSGVDPFQINEVVYRETNTSVQHNPKPTTLLHLYGGKSHNIYLGCLNSERRDENSIWNRFGKYGGRFAENSIWNQFGEFGGRFSDCSPWYQFSSTPPVVVDKEGNFYGYLTLNKMELQRATFKLAEILYENFKKIQEDPNKWYEIIFE